MYVDGQLFYTICIMELVSDTSSEDFYKKKTKKILINYVFKVTIGNLYFPYFWKTTYDLLSEYDL